MPVSRLRMRSADGCELKRQADRTGARDLLKARTLKQIVLGYRPQRRAFVRAAAGSQHQQERRLRAVRVCSKGSRKRSTPSYAPQTPLPSARHHHPHQQANGLLVKVCPSVFGHENSQSSAKVSCDRRAMDLTAKVFCARCCSTVGVKFGAEGGT